MLEYCRYGVKHKAINQSINQSINQFFFQKPVCGTTTMRSIQSVMDFVDKYRLIFNTTFGSGDPVIEEVSNYINGIFFVKKCYTETKFNYDTSTVATFDFLLSSILMFHLYFEKFICISSHNFLYIF